MSVQTNQYLMYGVMLNEERYDALRGEDEFDDKLEPYMESSAFNKEVKHHNGLFACVDISNGKWACIGRVIEKTDDISYIAEREPISINDTLSESERLHIRAKIWHTFPELLSIEPDFYIITQYR